jgi:hypothetical protein
MGIMGYFPWDKVAEAWPGPITSMHAEIKKAVLTDCREVTLLPKFSYYK